MQTTPQNAATHGGRIRRFFLGEPDDDPGPTLDLEHSPRGSNGGDPQANRVVDVRPVTAPDIGTVYLKVQRLEAGMRVIADTLKRSHMDLRRTMESLRDMLVAEPGARPPVLTSSLSPQEVKRVVEEATQPLESALNGLAETMHGVPLVVSSAADRLAAMIETARADIEANVIALLAKPWNRRMTDPPPITGAGEIWDKPDPS
jgi:hypothetical protein